MDELENTLFYLGGIRDVQNCTSIRFPSEVPQIGALHNNAEYSAQDTQVLVVVWYQRCLSSFLSSVSDFQKQPCQALALFPLLALREGRWLLLLLPPSMHAWLSVLPSKQPNTPADFSTFFLKVFPCFELTFSYEFCVVITCSSKPIFSFLWTAQFPSELKQEINAVMIFVITLITR